ncbi:dUTP diphosphatase [Bacillus safensis]|uniref:dUTP diphosphatase n=1 Tax=Bacillus safensis TaxID=561879 RepID=UPI002280C8D0|nr:dUTP diphosphatase [Bacillus safensis]MCY7542195.1 dUTP diphosphatase [Bacillus safensis]MCY7551817.1 dUTP diphosphatase [Bacillus safensis]MCY7644621.1 dUTP diphosphatase [Bacillus safensis]MCY7654594.1 dUTP diphosphatase [Bacillus safensis]MEC3711233.1 dUTP diphosphatase [Bacillus safensis]
MNLEKMFQMQAELDNRIIREKGLEGQDLLPGLILALQVELAECANEWRGFKFWSNDQQPCTEKKIQCSLCMGTGDENYERIAEDAEGIGGHEYIKCEECNGEGTTGTKNPLLEEYVDCLHFILSIGNLTKYSKNNDINDLKRNTLEASGVKAFLELFKEITFFNEERKVSKNTIGLTRIMIYERIFWRFNELGNALGFTPEQIEKAYMDKNAVNHKRQQEGY